MDGSTCETCENANIKLNRILDTNLNQCLCKEGYFEEK
jgi:hypothetical protein